MPIISIFNFISVLITYRKKEDFWETVDKYQFKNAYDVDVFSNRNHRAFWNLMCSKKGKNYKFGTLNELGYEDETLSSVLGYKGEEKSLTWFGWFVYYFLYTIDYVNWKNGGHCKNAYIKYRTKEINRKQNKIKQKKTK